MGDCGPMNRQGRGHGCLGKRRWDDTIQATEAENTGEPWQSAAQDRDNWHAVEPAVLVRVTRMAPESVHPVPRGRHMLEAPESELTTEWTRAAYHVGIREELMLLNSHTHAPAVPISHAF